MNWRRHSKASISGASSSKREVRLGEPVLPQRASRVAQGWASGSLPVSEDRAWRGVLEEHHGREGRHSIKGWISIIA